LEPEEDQGRSVRGIRRLAAVATFASYVAVALLGLANVILVSRSLGPSGRGQVAFLTTVATISGYVANLSLQEANANFAHRGSRLKAALGTNSLLLGLALSVVGALIAVAALTYLPFLSKSVATVDLAIALASIPAATLQIYFVYLARGGYHFTVTNVALLSGPAITLVANLAMLSVGTLSVTSALLAWLAGNVASASMLVLHHGRTAGFGAPDRALARETLAFGIQSHIGGIFATGSYSLDQWILGAASTSRELGLYSVAVSWFQGLFLLPIAIGVVARPDLVRLSRTDAAPYISSLYRVTIVATGLLATFLFVVAPVLCGRIFGPEFRDATESLRLLAPGALGVCTVKLLGTALIAQRRPLLESSAMGAGFLVAVVLYLVLIPAYGATGAAIASTIAYSTAGLAAAILITRTLSLSRTALIPRPSDFRRLAHFAATRSIK
jgi:O-antigen/teichoic acid export membrane protein